MERLRRDSGETESQAQRRRLNRTFTRASDGEVADTQNFQEDDEAEGDSGEIQDDRRTLGGESEKRQCNDDREDTAGTAGENPTRKG